MNPWKNNNNNPMSTCAVSGEDANIDNLNSNASSLETSHLSESGKWTTNSSTRPTSAKLISQHITKNVKARGKSSIDRNYSNIDARYPTMPSSDACLDFVLDDKSKDV